jgi:hypothetical protein
MTTKKKVETDPAKLPEVESNHNSLEAAKPVQTAQVKSMPDYNPMRREGNQANVHSDTTMGRRENEELVAEKGERETVLERDATNNWGEKTGASADGAIDGTDPAKTPTNKASESGEGKSIANKQPSRAEDGQGSGEADAT